MLLENPYLYLYGIFLIQFRHESYEILGKLNGIFLSTIKKNHVLNFRQIILLEYQRFLAYFHIQGGRKQIKVVTSGQKPIDRDYFVYS
jgi:hypothetical protein